MPIARRARLLKTACGVCLQNREETVRCNVIAVLSFNHVRVVCGF